MKCTSGWLDEPRYNEDEWYKGYQAFLDGLRYGDMATNEACDGWEAAWHDAHAVGQRIAKQGK